MASHHNHLYGVGYGEDPAYSRYAASDPYRFSFPPSDLAKYSSSDIGSSLYSDPGRIAAPWSGVEGSGLGAKRPNEALYHQSIGQSEALYSNSLYKHPRFETASNLPIYPQRPGVKDCTHYMSTRTCKYGEACKFHHPDWVPEGGIPDWKEVPQVPVVETLPERPGEPDCPYYLKTQKCKFGAKCKFNHPKDKSNALTTGDDAGGLIGQSLLPERPSEPVCAYFSKTGICKFGTSCKFHHPKDLQVPSGGQTTELTDSIIKGNGAASASGAVKTFAPVPPALLHNSKGLPIRLGETDCPFYLKTGSCKYGATCKYSHPDIPSMNLQFVGNLGRGMMPNASSLPIGLVNPAASFIPTLDPLLSQASLGVGPTVYPQRPGQMECDFYMKTGICKFGERCKFHHPFDRSAPTATLPQAQPNVKLTLAGLPRREGSAACPYYMKTGACKYGVTCKFDHPPPGEAVAMAAVQGSDGTGVAAAAAAAAGGDENAPTAAEQQ